MATKQKKSDLRRLVAAIEHESTGFSPLVCDRLQRICLALGSGEWNTQVLEERLSLSRKALRHAIAAGRHLGILQLRPHFQPNGNLPGIVSLNVTALRTVGRAKRPSSPFDHLPRRRRLLLERVDWKKTGLRGQRQWWNVARFCAAIGETRTCSYVELTAELSLNVTALRQHVIQPAMKIGVVRRMARSWQSSGQAPSTYTVNWDTFKGFGKPLNTRATSDLSPGSLRVPLYRRKLKRNHLTEEQRLLLDAVDWRKTGVRTREQWFNLKQLIGAIGNAREVGQFELARELGTSETPIQSTSKQGREVGLLQHKRVHHNGQSGSRTMRIVDWDRIRTLVGEQPKAATNGKPKAPATRQSSRATRKKTSGPDTAERDRLCEWLLAYQNDHDVSRPLAYKAYQNAHPGTPDRTPEALDQLFRRYWRSR